MIQKPLRRGIPNDLIDVQKRSAIFLNTPREKLVFPLECIDFPHPPLPSNKLDNFGELAKIQITRVFFPAVCEPNKQLDQFG